MPTLRGLRGLTASDRSESDKRAINQQQNDGANLRVSTPSAMSFDSKKSLQSIHDTEALMESTYQDMLQQYKEQYHVDNPNIVASTSYIQDVAYKVSPYYKKFIGSDYIDFSSNGWAKLAAQYEATRKAYGEEAANQTLNSAIKDNVAKNQPWYEQAWYGFKGLGASAAGAIISTAGAVKGAIDYLDGAYEDKEYMSGWENFMNSVLDNSWTRYGNDVVQYGSLRNDKINEAKELGISEIQIVESADQEDSLVSSATPWVALQSGGFTLASMFTGWGEAKLAGMVFKGLGTAAKAVKTGEQLTSALTKIQKVENFTNKFIIPGMVGTTEGLVEGLNTKQEAEQEGIRMVTEMHKQKVAEEVNRRLGEDYKKITDGDAVYYVDRDGNQVDIDALYNQVWSEFEPKYKESLDQVDYAATRAGINNFYANSLINGMINSTLKVGLQAAPVRKALQNSRLFGWAQPGPRFNVTGSGADVTVTPRFGKWNTAWRIAKEPMGEFAEEYIQSVSDATARGGAENNIHNFIENKYLGDGSAAVGDNFSSDWSAAWTALTGSLIDKETVKSGILGAVSSIMGTPAFGHKARTGKLNADGTAETTYFRRGLNEFGKQESNMERIGRILPWRSGLTGSIRDSRMARFHANDEAEALQEWLRDPDNKDKFDGLVGTFNWARQMGDAARGNDEFGYRNSALGKVINDVFMLQNLEGTAYYDSFINQLSEIANLEEGSDAANKYVSDMRDNVNTDSSTMSDEEILKTLKKNANLMLTTIDKVQQESDHIDKLLGNVDNDTKQTLIYGQMMLEDWRERAKTLREEVGAISIDNSREHSSNLTRKQKELIATYNSIAGAQKRLQTLEKSVSSVQEDIDNLSNRKNLTDSEKKVLKEKKTKLKTMKKEIKKLEDVRDFEGDIDVVLNEEEIMALDPISRATMLLNGKKKTYLATHDNGEFTVKKTALKEQIDKLQLEREKVLRSRNGRKKRRAQELQQEIDKTQKELDTLSADEKSYFSEEQQAVIDNLIASGIAQDRDFFDKVVDIGRLENSIRTFYGQYNAILSDKDSFNNFVYRAKQAAADIATKRRYDALNNMQDYSSFANELDKVFNDGSSREQAILTREFRRTGNANFDRYVNERNLIQGLVEHVAESGNFDDLSDNDADIFVHTLTYLSNKGIDFNSESDVVAVLSETDENGVPLLKKYVEEANQSLDEVDRAAFTSVGEAIQTFKNVMDSYRGQEIEREANSRPIIPEPTTPEQAVPTSAPEPTPATQPQRGSGFWDVGSSTPEGGYIRPDGTPIMDDTDATAEPSTEVPSQPTSPAESNPVLEEFKDNSNDEVARTAEIALNTIRNAPRVSDEARSEATSLVEGLSRNSFDSVDEFTSAIVSIANTMEAQSDEGFNETANLLRQIAAKATKAQTDSQPTATVTIGKRSSLLDRTRRQLSEANRRMNAAYDMFPNATYTSSFIASVNIDFLRQNRPNSSTVAYYDRYHIEEALIDGILEGNPDVMFITDAELEQTWKQEYSSYDSSRDMPVVAVVESSNGPIEIDGKHYQPVGIMAGTKQPTPGLTDEQRRGSEWSAGAAHMAPIRSLAQANQGKTQLIRTADGKPLVTKSYGHPKAYPIDRGYRGRNDVIEIGINDLPQSERTQVQAASKPARRNSPSYQRAKRNFIKRLGVKDNGGRKMLFFAQSRLNGGINPIEIFTSPINETTARDSNATFAEVVSSNDSSAIINFNSRTSRAAKAFGNFAISFSSDEMIFDLDDRGQIVPTDATKGVLSGLASSLERSVSNFINVPISQGWTYSISPTMDTVGENRVMDVSLVNSNNGQVIPLTKIRAGMTEAEVQSAQAEFLKNLITDNGTIRTSSANDSFAKWNVPYSDVKEAADNRSAAANISDIYDDGILGAAATSFNYKVQGIAVQNPFRSDGTPVFTQVANQTNAQPSTPVNQPTVTANNQVQSGSAIVDGDTGTALEGTPTAPVNQAQQAAADTVTKIEDDSKNIVLSDDGSTYVDKRTGTRYFRVTSIIAADERADGDRFDPSNPWATPSTNIGTGVDEFVRDYFAGVVDERMSELEKFYPNASQQQLERFASQLEGLRNNFLANGLTVVPRDVTVTGSLDVADTEGKVHTVNVAGTLDLLAYDARGNFYIFDMKTYRSNIDERKKEKYARQLSLYKKFLGNKYGVKVNSMQLIPIKVDYPAPVGAKSKGGAGTADYSVSAEQPNQLLIDGKKFRDAKPALSSIINVNYQEPYIKWDKMTDNERAMLAGLEEVLSAQAGESITPTEAIVSEPEEAPVDPTLGASFDDSYLGGMFGDESITTSGFSAELGERTTPIPEHLKWENLTQEQRENLEMMGFDESQWFNTSDDEMEQFLECMG